MFEISRNYKELVERLDIERADDYIEFLPYDVIGAAVNDNNVVNDEVITYLDVYKRQELAVTSQGHR